MPPNPQWVKKLAPASPHGGDLLAKERAASNIDVDQLAEYMFTKEALDQRERILKVLAADPVFDKSQNYFQGRDARIKASLGKAKRLTQLAIQHKWSPEDHACANELLTEVTPYRLHDTMFLITLREQGTPVQQRLFLKKAENYEIIGCYAQTELGHGSNVRGLETTATWNQGDKTFILHSPTLTASKWWIGTLGKTANHAVVMAQLIIGGKHYGPHPFLVQIRDMKTHEVLPDVHVGDIGPKFGFNTMDNGFLLLNQLKIPHINMLARFSRVDPETGKYQRPANPSLIYGTLTWVRSNIVLQSGSTLARGVTIATRYCAVRRQFQDLDAAKDAVGENQVLNYTMVQYRLLPLLAATYALHFTGQSMIRLYQENQKRMSAASDGRLDARRRPGPEELNPGTDLLADLHATSCALKAYGSTVAGEGLETCRRACGGHGYSSFSGIGSYYADYLPTLTWEGDNYMLTQQVCRYLLKSARAVISGKAGENDTTRILKTYLARRDTTGAAYDILASDSDLVAAYAWRVAHMTFEALQRRDVEKQSWNSLLVDFYRLSTAHAQYMVVKSFYDALFDQEQAQALENSLDRQGVAVLHKLFRLFALHTLVEREADEFFAAAATTARQISLARRAVMALLAEIRPHAVRLVDVWKFPDWQLDSSLGRYDGRVYEDMFHRASELNPLNDVVFDSNPNSKVLFRGEAGISSKL
ncbi:Acyl-coenzyme A oxidase [Apiospora hydei]|uniref:Acyl-coenzyme A oxidase n=1 Tax=Apiospora hydei TaxID=1337664 RepID=A0ABR1W7L4_9PEZI